MNPRLPDYFATRTTQQLLADLGLAADDPAQVLLCLAYRLTARLERGAYEWGQIGTTCAAMRFPVGGLTVEVAARLVEDGGR